MQMNTQTQNHLISRDERRAFEAAWRAYVATGKADAAAFILQAILRGRNPKLGFTPVTNAVKLANGQFAWQGYSAALSQLRGQLGSYVHAIWPELMGKGLGSTRYESLVKELAAALEQLKREA
ncbi:hypothetical protein WJ97_14060 [Burkholderia ubonensis]|nr:hypothetical protein WJ97_14060 [Burkholderia ubonensis]